MDKAIVLLSGGMDSATCLAIASESYEVHSLSFDYGQVHSNELTQAVKLSKLAKVERHQIIKVPLLRTLVPSALFHSALDVNEQHPWEETLPASFVPGRNILFLTLAGMYAFTEKIFHIFIGANQEDYSGYPDCREAFIENMQRALREGLNRDISIHTPLMHWRKTDIIDTMLKMGKIHWLANTITCYRGESPPCGDCPSCKIRANAFKELGLTDPLFM